MLFGERFLRFLDRKVEEFGAQYKTFALFVFITYPLGYFTLYFIGSQANESALIRSIALFMCLPLLITNYWPIWAKKYLNVYWFITLLYCLPILGVYSLLKNQMSTEWLMNIVLGIFLLILLVDWTVFIITYSLGILLGYLLFLTTGQELIFQKTFAEIFSASHMYIYAIIIGVIFARGNERTHKEKIQTMKMLAGSIAHELRTPLSAMMMNAKALSKFIPFYQDAYAKAKVAQLSIHKITTSEEKFLNDIPQEMQIISQNAHTMITMLLANLNEGASDKKVELCSLKLCVEEALKNYPFSTSERELAHWECEGMTEDFTFLGHKELTKHVLFNLIKNALYAIASAGKGGIFISIQPDETNITKGRLVFKDTGLGIPPENLRHVFDRFYTKTEHGTGIGLAFCKSVIEGFGGSITCTSKEGEHTTFTITLPFVTESSHLPT